MAPLPDLSALSSSEKDTLITALVARTDALVARVEALEAENAALREKLNLPPKTPDNSSTPPQHAAVAGREGESKAKPKGKAHAGAHRPLHPTPTRRRDMVADHCPHCRADVTGVAQAPLQVYDRIDIPEITPDVTRVTLFGGTCPCCHGRFKAAPPAGLEPGSPFGPNLRAFILYLRFGQAIPFERLERLMLDLFGLEISEGALANLLADSAPAFAVQTSRIKERLLSGTLLHSEETSVRVGKRTFWTGVFHHADSACTATAPRAASARQGRGRGVPRRGPPRDLGLRPPRRPDGGGRPRTIRPASPICCATSSTPSSTPSTPETRSSRPPP